MCDTLLFLLSIKVLPLTRERAFPVTKKDQILPEQTLECSINRTMVPPLVRIDASESLDSILKVVERDGGVIVTNFLSPELLNELMAAGKPPFVVS